MTHQTQKYPSRLKIFTLKEKAEVENKLKEQFGVKKVEGLLITRGEGEERLFLYQGSFNPKQIQEIEQTLPVERVGIYFGKEVNDKIRLSIEGTQLLSSQITKNIFELNEQQAEEWMLGRELQIITEKKDFLVIKYKNHFLGTGKASELKISNFIPKNRRLKNKEN